MLYTLFAKVEYAWLATIAGAHAGLELWVFTHATVSFFVAHAYPRLFDVLVKLKFVLWVHLDSYLGRGTDISHIILHARHDCIGNHLGVSVLDDGFLQGWPSHSNCFTLFSSLTSSHV